MQIKSSAVTSKKILKATATDFHLFFYGFLRISPSYQLAHRYVNQELDQNNEIVFPNDFDLVLEKYQIFGDVINQQFESWWLNKGNTLFKQNEKSKKIILDLDLKKTEKENLTEISKILKILYSRNRETKEVITIPKNKIHSKSLAIRMEIATAKPYGGLLLNDYKVLLNSPTKKLKDWQLASYMSKFSKYQDDIDPLKKPLASNKTARDELSKSIAKYIREARLISENAARGIFPSLENNDNFLDFDTKYICKVMKPIYSVVYMNVLNYRKDRITKDLGHKIYREALLSWYSIRKDS